MRFDGSRLPRVADQQQPVTTFVSFSSQSVGNGEMHPRAGSQQALFSILKPLLQLGVRFHLLGDNRQHGGPANFRNPILPRP